MGDRLDDDDEKPPVEVVNRSDEEDDDGEESDTEVTTSTSAANATAGTPGGEEGEEDEAARKERKRKKKEKREKREKKEQRRRSREVLEGATALADESAGGSGEGLLERRKSKDKLERRQSKEKLERRKSKENLERRKSRESVELKDLGRQDAVAASTADPDDTHIEDLMAQEEEEVAKLKAKEKERELEVVVVAAEEDGPDGKKGKKGKKDKKGKGKEEGGKPGERKVGYFELFRFADGLDYLLMFVGVISAMGHGCLMPLFSIFFGDVIDAFNPGSTVSLTAVVTDICIKFIILSAVAAVTAFLQISTLTLSGQRQSNRMRQTYFRSLLRQEIGWYDLQETGELTARIAGDVVLIQDAISEKIGTFVQMFTMFIAGFIVGFVEGWRLALVILSVVPLLVLCGALMGKFITEFTNKSQTSFGKAGAVAEEVISSMRTVAAFGGEKVEQTRFGEALSVALDTGIKRAYLTGGGIGVTMFVMFGSYSLSFWYGNQLIQQDLITGGHVITVFFAIVIGAMSIGQASPALTAFSTGTGAAGKIYAVIERQSLVDSIADEGLKPDTARGEVSFQDVHFTYPSRPDQPILRGLSFSLKPGQTLAFVGQSGCGKSTSVALLERFYDPSSGIVSFDGVDVRSLSVQWLRRQIGFVGQEPILFNKTIAENICFGRDGVTQEEVEAACRKANAHDFIMKLPLKYATHVGERGTQLSGGQKQRIAIARALVRDPKVLLLDEATSALDNNSEKVVQDALDKASKGRSTIVIAHRLSTIRDADIICVMDKGVIVERGTHEELMNKEGGSLYLDLVKLQEIAGRDEEKVKEKRPAVDPNDIPVPGSEAAPANGASPASKPDRRKPSERLPSAGRPSAKRPSTPGDGAAADEAPPLNDAERKQLEKGVVLRSFKYNLPELGYIFFGALGAICNGAVFPVFSIIFGEIINTLLEPDAVARNAAVVDWCLGFLGLAVGTGLANFFQSALFGISGERLTTRLRNMLFGAIVRQDVGWFDLDSSATGVLATKLSNDASQVKGMTGERIGLMLQLLSTMVAGLLIGFISCWRLALVVLACVPAVAVAGALQLKLLTGFNAKAKVAYEESGQIATEAIMNMRTVTSLGIQDQFIDFYRISLQPPDRGARRSAIVSGLGFGFAEASQFLIWALAFWYGSNLAADGECDFAGMMKAISAVLFSAIMLGQMSSLMPDFGKAKAAAASIYAILDRVPVVDSFSSEGTRLDSLSGTIEFRDVHFCYPTRPTTKILKGLNFKIKPGQTLALVGPSGCGKSTSVALIERFYNPAEGQIFIDGIEIRSLNVGWLRRQIGLVSQEPVLFGTSIGENIAYGRENAEATQEQIIDAAKIANAHKFISALAEGYDTDVGEKGSQLSGGQKQRVAIARALIRNPKILLLDEATSALDSESEKLVQHALNKARQGRTTIVIAHRLSTIQNADQIAVIDNGVVFEQGTHFELLAKKGLYYRLVNKIADKEA